ncbi:hypothetical protein PCURB6_10240 [Paenibacillus curdlanolyticus]|nr:hypothetical protein PCURB6_10240 [Paenibacillus curdlanolyticus]
MKVALSQYKIFTFKAISWSKLKEEQPAVKAITLVSKKHTAAVDNLIKDIFM